MDREGEGRGVNLQKVPTYSGPAHGSGGGVHCRHLQSLHGLDKVDGGLSLISLGLPFTCTSTRTWIHGHRHTETQHTDTWTRIHGHTHTQLHPAWGCEATTFASALSKGLLIYFFEKPGTSSHPVSNPRGGPVHRRPGAVAVILGTSGTGGGRPSGSPLMSLVQGPDRSLAVAAEGSDLCRGSGPLSPMPPLDSRTSLHHPLEDSHPHRRTAGWRGLVVDRLCLGKTWP